MVPLTAHCLLLTAYLPTPYLRSTSRTRAKGIASTVPKRLVTVVAMKSEL